ncbi:uncharacterized protein BP5553_07103 [Venustampulla echinocandica]|uniref:Serine-rich protein n=1 Tax=Venustampulla echinocandica TaxID=2656787 RepID=A0A370TII3_9HELO|nr:uncharacterized protein BP5553_07103 [Venustampulla echinocandica]RDL35172.1 hypothetical protein BP5553_07103 [Venustampulla echinocandica]
MPEHSPSRRPLHERSSSHSNRSANALSSPRAAGAIRLVPSTPPQLLSTNTSIASPSSVTSASSAYSSSSTIANTTTSTAETGSDATSTSNPNCNPNPKDRSLAVTPRDEIYSRTPLPTHPSHILLAPARNKDAALVREFRTSPNASNKAASSGPSVSSTLPTHTTHHQSPSNGDPDTGSPISKPKPPAKKRLHIHRDNKTFSLLEDGHAQSVDASPRSPVLALSRTSSFDSLASEAYHARGRSNSEESCLPSAAATPAPEEKNTIPADPIANSPWNYQLVGGLRKVPKTPDLKHKISESPLPPLPELSDVASAASPELFDIASAASPNLSTKPSFRSTGTATTTSENTNYKVYGDISPSISHSALPQSSPANSNYQLIGPPSEPSTTSSVIYRPQTAISEDENYQLWGEPSLAESSENLVQRPKYSQESLVVPPLRPRARRSNENFGYYKSRSRESLRTGSLTSISSVLYQQEAAHAIPGSGPLIALPILTPATEESGVWAETSGTYPPRAHMNDHPHQWSSQLSTVVSESEGGSLRDFRELSSEHGRRSSGFRSIGSRTSRPVLSIGSSSALEEVRSESLESPEPAVTRGGRRHPSSSSIPVVGDQDEYGDGITDMQDLRARPSRAFLSSGYFSSASSDDNGRTSTMRSTGSSRANSLLANSLPSWAKVYYGSGERRYLAAPASSAGSINSRQNSFRSGSPNTDHFPINLHSPRRRPRELRLGGHATQDSLEVSSAEQSGGPERHINHPYNSRRYRTWSLSSVWSPHLRMDRRATGHTMWDPPSVNWSTDGSWHGRRNVQIVMFVMGFIFPFAWMIAACLPLPMNPASEMQDQDPEGSSSNTNNAPNDYAREFGPMDMKRFENARWWRNLNRWMSVIGVFIIAAVVIISIVSVKQGWRKS